MNPNQSPHFLVAGMHSALALIWFMVSFIANDFGALVAISISGMNAVAAVLSGYAAVRTLKKRRAEKEEE